MIGISHEDGSADFLLTGAWSGAKEQALWRWKEANPDGVGAFTGEDYRRLQLEMWLYQHRDRLTGRVMDIGVYDRKNWVGPGYFTFGERDSDVNGDLLNAPFESGSVDAILCCEVLEHVRDPFQACRELGRMLKPGGLLLASAPFMWPDHGVEGQYRDYWRILANGWTELLKDFQDVQIVEPAWTTEGEALFHLLRRFEGWGFNGMVRANTGYFVSAVRP